jgi:Uma2 family endonuclease
VAETSLAEDRVIKSGIYAGCGVPEYWVVNLPENKVEIQTGIENSLHSRYRRAGRGDTIALQAFPDIMLPVDAFLG